MFGQRKEQSNNQKSNNDLVSYLNFLNKQKAELNNSDLISSIRSKWRNAKRNFNSVNVSIESTRMNSRMQTSTQNSMSLQNSP